MPNITVFTVQRCTLTVTLLLLVCSLLQAFARMDLTELLGAKPPQPGADLWQSQKMQRLPPLVFSTAAFECQAVNVRHHELPQIDLFQILHTRCNGVIVSRGCHMVGSCLGSSAPPVQTTPLFHICTTAKFDTLSECMVASTRTCGFAQVRQVSLELR